MIAHITLEELRRHLDATEIANGFANRFIFIAARRSKLLPDGGSLADADVEPPIAELREAARFAGTVERMERDSAARQLWHRVYEQLSRGRPGLVGSLTARAEAQVLRLAMIYALLDLSNVIKEMHLQAALDLWSYAERSVEYIFGNSVGYPDADTIKHALAARHDEGMSRTEIRDLFSRNRKAVDIDKALDFLADHGLIISRRQAETGGRPAERWYSIAHLYDRNDIYDRSAAVPDRGQALSSFRSFRSSPEVVQATDSEKATAGSTSDDVEAQEPEDDDIPF